jgi:hypothetical protein
VAEFAEERLFLAGVAIKESEAGGVFSADAGFEEGEFVQGVGGRAALLFAEGLDLQLDVPGLDGTETVEAVVGQGKLGDEALGLGAGRLPSAGEVFVEGLEGGALERMEGFDAGAESEDLAGVRDGLWGGRGHGAKFLSGRIVGGFRVKSGGSCFGCSRRSQAKRPKDGREQGAVGPGGKGNQCLAGATKNRRAL